MAAVGEAAARTELRSVLHALGSPRVAAACAGAAGGDSYAARDRIHGLLAEVLPGAAVLVVHDARLVLAAAGLESGVALIAGTGSVAYARAPDGREGRAGGWGHLLGDEGSGYWMVREAARRSLEEQDQGRPPGLLARALMDSFGARNPADLLHLMHERREPAAWAARAQVVFQAAGSDPDARAVVAAAAAALAGLALRVGRRLLLEGPIVLAGGLLLGQPELEGDLRMELGRQGFRGDAVRLEAPPVAGAVRLAQELLA